LILFFLPWLELCCVDAKGERTDFVTVSGARLLFGSSTPRSAQAEETDPRWVLMQCMLAVYLFFLIAGLLYALVQPQVTRAVLGTLHALLLVGLLATAFWVSFGNPLSLGEPERGKRWTTVARYTPWYYASYVANFLALVCFLVEFWVVLGSRRPSSEFLGAAGETSESEPSG
jgi:uncharacterized membrane protein YbhN (UPF0104 family)